MSELTDEFDKLSKIAKIEDIVSMGKSGSFPFEQFVVYVTNNEEGRKLLMKVFAIWEEVEDFLKTSVKTMNLKTEDFIIESKFNALMRKDDGDE